MDFLEYENFTYWIKNATCRELIEAFKLDDRLHKLIMKYKRKPERLRYGIK